MEYKVGDIVRVHRGYFEVRCEIIEIDKEKENSYRVEGAFTRGWTNEKNILGYTEQ